jgi:hypothetical protein
MPKAAIKKRKVVKKDVIKNELPKEEKETKEQSQVSIRNCQGPITININSNNKTKLIKEPENINEHWTQDPLDDRWLYLWHYEQKITKLQSEFFLKINWEVFGKINYLFEAKKILLEEGRILETIPIEGLKKLYYTGEVNLFKNYNNNYYQQTYYQFTDIPEEGEIIEEVSRNNRIKGRQPIQYSDDHLFY